MISTVSYGSCQIWDIGKGAPMVDSTFHPLDTSTDQNDYFKPLDKTNMDDLHTFGVHSFWNRFWQYPLCNVYLHWQPDELHQLLLGWVKDLMHWLLKYLTRSNVKDLYDNQFTSAPQYPYPQYFCIPFDLMSSSSWQVKLIRGIIGTLAVNCDTIPNCSKDDRKTALDTTPNEMVLGAKSGFCE